MAMIIQFKGTEQQKNNVTKDGTTGPVLENSMVHLVHVEDVNVSVTVNVTETGDDGTTGPVFGDSMLQILKDENVTGTRDAFESQQNEEWSHLISIAKCFPEIKNNERMGDIEFEAEDEEKDVPKRQSTDQTKVEDRPNPGKVKGDITGLSSRWIPTQWEQILKPQRMKQLIFTLKKIYSWILLICSLLPGAGAQSTFEVEKVAMNITITAGMSLSVTYPVPRLPTGAHFSIIRESGDQELNCSKTLIFVADNPNCILGPGNEGPCQALILYHLGSKDFLQLEGTVMEPGTYKYCIIQQVPENFVLYEFMVVREPDPTVPSIFQNVTAVTELPITACNDAFWKGLAITVILMAAVFFCIIVVFLCMHYFGYLKRWCTECRQLYG